MIVDGWSSGAQCVWSDWQARIIAKADIRRVQEWMGHADVQTTMKYLHYAPRAEDAALVAEAFALEPAEVQDPLAEPAPES